MLANELFYLFLSLEICLQCVDWSLCRFLIMDWTMLHVPCQGICNKGEQSWITEWGCIACCWWSLWLSASPIVGSWICKLLWKKFVIFPWLLYIRVNKWLCQTWMQMDCKNMYADESRSMYADVAFGCPLWVYPPCRIAFFIKSFTDFINFVPLVTFFLFRVAENKSSRCCWD